MLSDNGSPYGSRLWASICHQFGITAKKTRPYRPQTTASSNASTAPWPTAGPTPATTSQRPNAEPLWPGGSTNTITTDPPQPSQATPPISRLTNVPGQYSKAAPHQPESAGYLSGILTSLSVTASAKGGPSAAPVDASDLGRAPNSPLATPPNRPARPAVQGSRVGEAVLYTLWGMARKTAQGALTDNYGLQESTQ